MIGRHAIVKSASWEEHPVKAREQKPSLLPMGACVSAQVCTGIFTEGLDDSDNTGISQ